MKLVLVCTAVVLLLSAVELSRPAKQMTNSIAQIFSEANATPVPQSQLNVYFGDIEVTPGMELAPAEAMYPPTIKFDFEPSCYYTFIEISPDWPSSKYPYLGASVLGLYPNIYSDSKGILVLEDFCEALPWAAPDPPAFTGPHRYLIYLFRQNGDMIDINDEELLRLKCDRVRFSLDDFVRTYDLNSPPIAGTMFYSQYRLPYCED